MLAEIPSPRGSGIRLYDGKLHCPRAFRRLVTSSPYLVGYCRWDGRSGRMGRRTITHATFMSQPFVKSISQGNTFSEFSCIPESRFYVNRFRTSIDPHLDDISFADAGMSRRCEKANFLFRSRDNLMFLPKPEGWKYLESAAHGLFLPPVQSSVFRPIASICKGTKTTHQRNCVPILSTCLIRACV